MNSITIIIPTLNGGEIFEKLFEKLGELEVDKLILESGDPLLYSSGLIDKRSVIYKIEKSYFNHGRTRNIGALLAKCPSIYIFMTQDAMPVGDDWLKELIAPILSGEVAATFARQLPRPVANSMERFARYFNYPSVSRLRTHADIAVLGVKAYFFSNVCSAVSADAFWEVGGFPENLIMNEDMMLAAKLMEHGYATKYVAESVVIHSHDYTIVQQFRRTFDVGVFMADAGERLQGAHTTGEGIRFVLAQAAYVWRAREFRELPLVFVEAAARFLAFQLGKRHHLLPRSLKRRFSMHSYHWNQQRGKI